MKTIITLMLIPIAIALVFISYWILMIDNFYWITVSYFVVRANEIGISLYDFYVIVFIVLIPFLIIQSVLFFIIKRFRKKSVVIDGTASV